MTRQTLQSCQPSRLRRRGRKSMPSRTPRRRKGAAVIELAVCLPVVLLIVFGSIEAASLLFLRQAMVQASYEGVKVAIRDDGTTAAARIAAENVIAGRRLNGVDIQFSPANVESAAPGELIRVTVTAPGNTNTLFPFGVFLNNTVGGDAVMAKE